MAALYFISFNLLKLQMPSFQNDIRVSFLSKKISAYGFRAFGRPFAGSVFRQR
jgi:hypothetical protein